MSDESKTIDLMKALKASLKKHVAASPVPSPPEWGEPDLIGGNVGSIRADCGCYLSASNQAEDRSLGRHCAVHTFADLVSGESRLRAALQKGGER